MAGQLPPARVRAIAEGRAAAEVRAAIDHLERMAPLAEEWTDSWHGEVHRVVPTRAMQLGLLAHLKRGQS